MTAKPDLLFDHEVDLQLDEERNILLEMARSRRELAQSDLGRIPIDTDKEVVEAARALTHRDYARKIAKNVEVLVPLLDAIPDRRLRLMAMKNINRLVKHVEIEDSKAGPKQIYLSAAAFSILSAVPRLADNPYLIPGRKPGGHRAELKAPWTAVARAAGLTRVRIHDLRDSFASVGAGASLGLPIIARLLGHSQPATTARYAHLDVDPMRRAANTIGAMIAAAMEAREPAPAVSIRGRTNDE